MENQRKSRGSFVDVRRKSLTFNNIFNDSKEIEANNVEKPRHSMKTYLDSLTKENQDWKNILQQKKDLYKAMKDSCKFDPLTICKEDVEEFISVDDKDFLDSKPNYLEMMNSVKKYIDSVNYLNQYKLDVIDFYNKACEELNINTKVLVDNMCADDLCELCNMKNCKDPEHQFIV